MPAFFSGEDTGTLNKEGMDRNHFVSLVVNNAGNYVARITRKLTSTTKSHVIQSTSITYPTFEDQIKTISENVQSEYDAKDEVKTKIEFIDLNVEKANVTIQHNKYLARLWDIRQNPRVGGSKAVITGYRNPVYGCAQNYMSNPVNPNIPATPKSQVPAVVPPATQIKAPTNIQREIPFSAPKELTLEEMTALRCSAEVTEGVIKQLLTGCIIPNDKIDLKTLDCKAVEDYFNSYFGTTDYGKKLFEDFAGVFCEFIIEHTYDEDMFCTYDIAEGDMQEILARSVVERLEEFKCTNFYIQTYIKELNEAYIEYSFNGYQEEDEIDQFYKNN